MKKITRTFCLTHSPGQDIYLFNLYNEKGTEVSITNYGAIITAIKIKMQDGSINDIVLGFDKPEDYWSAGYVKEYPWFGAAVGRYANRIKNASFPLNGEMINLSANRGNNQLHGGHQGFDRKVWEIVSFGHHPHLFVELKYLSKDGEEGFPGNLETCIRFELTDNNELSYEYKATTDKATAVNLTHHGYFNLNNGEGTIHDHELTIYSKQVLEQASDLTATGKYEDVAGTVFDFSKSKKTGDGLMHISEYDKSYVVAADAGKNTHLVAELKSEKTGIALQIFSTEPVVHFYSGKWIPGVTGKYGTTYGPFSGLCLETHKHPNAVNIPSFPKTILHPGETYFQKTVYRILS